jgi:small-conductance mechanosensitive channel
VAEVANGIFEWVATLWRAELLSVAGRSVSIGTIVTSLLLLLLGILLARWSSRRLAALLARHVGLEHGAAAAVQSLTFYLLLVLVVLFALQTARIPLTAFTVFGGALAIGVGFGSQNVVNNFLSGLILMIERPIKVGDVVDVEGTYGRVERIGPRSTRIKTFDNTHIIIPNSAFLERNVVNWTISDNMVRTSVDVGVAYGSPTREVDRLVHRVLAEHGKILKKPAPVVLFTEFGDNALNFRAYFWLQMREMMDRRRVESDVRYRIDHLFRDAGIAIAFPQRDVHLDTAAPLDVRLVERPNPDATGRPQVATRDH